MSPSLQRDMHFVSLMFVRDTKTRDKQSWNASILGIICQYDPKTVGDDHQRKRCSCQAKVDDAAKRNEPHCLPLFAIEHQKKFIHIEHGGRILDLNGPRVVAAKHRR